MLELTAIRLVYVEVFLSSQIVGLSWHLKQAASSLTVNLKAKLDSIMPVPLKPPQVTLIPKSRSYRARRQRNGWTSSRRGPDDHISIGSFILVLRPNLRIPEIMCCRIPMSLHVSGSFGPPGKTYPHSTSHNFCLISCRATALGRTRPRRPGSTLDHPLRTGTEVGDRKLDRTCGFAMHTRWP